MWLLFFLTFTSSCSTDEVALNHEIYFKLYICFSCQEFFIYFTSQSFNIVIIFQPITIMHCNSPSISVIGWKIGRRSNICCTIVQQCDRRKVDGLCLSSNWFQRNSLNNFFTFDFDKNKKKCALLIDYVQCLKNDYIHIRGKYWLLRVIQITFNHCPMLIIALV